MRILILGEGPTDLGRFDRDGVLEQEGVVPVLVRRLLLEKDPQLLLEFRVKTLASTMLLKKPSEKLKASRHGFLAKFRAVIGLPIGRWADAVVAVVDRDEKKHQERLTELNNASEFLQSEGKMCAVGLAIEEIEAWLLADEIALRSALNDESIQLPPSPENLTSRDDKSEKSPKGLLRSLMETALNRQVSRDEYLELCSAIAMQIDLSRLEKRCPNGFQPFAAQVRTLLHPTN